MSELSTGPAMISAADVVSFWRDAGPTHWFKKSGAFDAQCRWLEPAHHAAAQLKLTDWETTPEGALAIVLLLDQIPRNIYRGSAHAFATDGLALAIASRAMAAGHDLATAMPLRVFFYLPFEHAEHLDAQEQAVAFIEATGDAEYAKYARLHRDVIARFGRFPHRNAALGRATTADERDFLAAGGFAG